jgi:hypothetical protein
VLNNTRKIIDFLKSRAAGQALCVLPEFNLTHLFCYAGAHIIMGAMGVTTTDAFNRVSDWALTAAGAVYAIVLATGKRITGVPDALANRICRV